LGHQANSFVTKKICLNYFPSESAFGLEKRSTSEINIVFLPKFPNLNLVKLLFAQLELRFFTAAD